MVKSKFAAPAWAAKWWAGKAKIPAATGIDAALAFVINLTHGVSYEAENPLHGYEAVA